MIIVFRSPKSIEASQQFRKARILPGGSAVPAGHREALPASPALFAPLSRAGWALSPHGLPVAVGALVGVFVQSEVGEGTGEGT